MRPERTEITGPATLIQGDCLEVMGGLGPVGHVITDPPYEDELHEAIGRIRRTDGKAMISTLGFGGINAIRADVAKAVAGIADGWAILFCLAEGVRAWRDDLQAAGAKWDTTLAWVKPDAMPRMNGQGAARGFECAISCWCGGGGRRWNEGGKRGVYIYTVNPPGRDGRHPTEKPLALMREIIRDFTQPGDTILDPFMGSGTTGVAAMIEGRKFIGIEKDPQWFGVALERVGAAAGLFDDAVSGGAPSLFGDLPKSRRPKAEGAAP
jgi:site-specific DNA-methyltransferase (adenine-specific)